MENNLFNVVTELTYKNGEDEFRPDVIMLINGIPEVKKTNKILITKLIKVIYISETGIIDIYYRIKNPYKEFFINK